MRARRIAILIGSIVVVSSVLLVRTSVRPDRRLGDYFTIDVDTSRAVVAAYSDTSIGGAVSLLAFVRQTGGPSFSKVKTKGGD